jgi:hypothetical protein
MPNFDFMKLSLDEQDKLLRGHGRFVGSCGHTLMNCRCPGERTTVPLMIRCAECDDSVSEDDIYEAVKVAREGFQKQSLFGMLGLRKKPDRGSSGVAVLDPPSFEQYIKSLNLEPIEKVRERFERTKEIDDMVRYMQRGQQDRDLNRLSFETGYVKSPAGEVIVNEDPHQLRSRHRSYVNKFYSGLEKKSPSKQLEHTPMMRAKVAAYLGELSSCLKAIYPEYSERLSSLSLKVSPAMYQRRIAADSLRKLSKKLAGYPSYVLLMERIAEELDHQRKTTKDDPPIAKMIQESEGNLVDFMKKINEMAKPDKGDTYKDLLIKRIYRAFLHDLQLKKIDTPEEIAATNKPADKIIAEIEMAAKPTESLIKRIEDYERKFTK